MKDNLIPIGKMAAMNRVSVPHPAPLRRKGPAQAPVRRSGNGIPVLRHRPERPAGYDRLHERARHEPGPDRAGAAKGGHLPDRGAAFAEKRARSTSRCVSSRPSTTRWSGRSCPSSGTASLRRPARSLWSISTGASPGASPAHTTFIRTTCTATSKSLRALRLKLEEKGFQQIHSYNIGHLHPPGGLPRGPL